MSAPARARQPWGPGEDEYLRENAGCSIELVARELLRTPGAVHQRAMRIGVRLEGMAARTWPGPTPVPVLETIDPLEAVAQLSATIEVLLREERDAAAAARADAELARIRRAS